jgi:peptidoglycan-associated lipoprotein
MTTITRDLAPRGGRAARWLGIAVCAALLSACASHPKPPPPTPVAPPPPPPAAPPPAPIPAPPPPPVQSGPLPGTVQDFVVNVGDRVYFEYDKYEIRADALPILAKQAEWLSRYPAVQVRIEGNCDERGTREYNFALGARRAGAVKTFLVDHGVSLARVTTVSYGKERPLDPGTGEAAWSRNRNAHTDITSGAK